jgi:hypothetical protein
LKRFLAAVAAGVLLAACSSSTPTVAINQAQALQKAVDGYAGYYNGAGEWNQPAYLTNDWEKFQGVAVGDAALASIPTALLSGSQLLAQQPYLKTAVATVNQAIAIHQTLPDGDFDNGTPAAGDSGVGGTFWGEAEGLIALTLEHEVSQATLANWQDSMRRYANYLWATQLAPPHDWYANGNVVLRETVILLETWELTGDSTFQAEYQQARQFLTTPGTVDPKWSAEGWRTGTGGAGWYTESTSSLPNAPLTCANGQNPCNGFDPNYTSAQLIDAEIAYTISNDPAWLAVIQAENTALQPLVTAQQMLDGVGGSRQNVWQPFTPPVYEMLDERNLAGGDETAWQAQMVTEGNDFGMWARQASTPGDNAFSMVEAPALAVIDTERNLEALQ